jgi:hypothetical protein
MGTWESAMTDDNHVSDVHAAWRQDPTIAFRLGPEETVRRNRRVEMDVRAFSTQVYVASFFNLLMWAAFAVILSGVVARVGAILALAGLCAVILEVALHRRRTLASVATMAPLPGLTFYRAALERERAFYRDAALLRRFVALVVGPMIFLYGSTMGDKNGAVVSTLVSVVWLFLFSIGVFGGRRRRRALQRQIDDLDSALSSRA